LVFEMPEGFRLGAGKRFDPILHPSGQTGRAHPQSPGAGGRPHFLAGRLQTYGFHPLSLSPHARN
jgi:hypothetical protein